MKIELKLTVNVTSTMNVTLQNIIGQAINPLTFNFNFHPLEVGNCVSETQLQAGENDLDLSKWRLLLFKS